MFKICFCVLAMILTNFFNFSFLKAATFFLLWKKDPLSLKYGNSLFSTTAYSAYAMMTNIAFKDYDKAYAWGIMALDLSEQRNNSFQKAIVNMMFCFALNHWKKPLRSSM